MQQASPRAHIKLSGKIKARENGLRAAECMSATFIIFFMEKARLMVTARGRPSGTATTRMVTPKMKNCSGPSPNWDIGNPLFSIIHLGHSVLHAIAHKTDQSARSACHIDACSE